MAVAVGCTSNPDPTDGPPSGAPTVDASASALAAGLSEFDVAELLFVNAAADAQAELEVLTAGLGSLRPAVSVSSINYNETVATAQLDYSYPVHGADWRFSTSATFELLSNQWRIRWTPQLLHSQLSAQTRLSATRKTPARAAINGADGLALMEETPVTRIGLDKANMVEADFKSSAKRLAKILKVDQDAYVAKVMASGEQAYVVALTVRKGELPPEVMSVPGVYLQESTAILGPTPSFAAGLLGVTGDATAEIIENSEGEVAAGDVVGLTGMQQRHDEQLRGEPGYTIELVYRDGEPADESPAPTSASPSEPVELPLELFRIDPTPGTPIATTIDPDVQFKAEDALKAADGVAALVVMDVNTGAVLAAANSADAGANPYATTGRYPPGSTFKIIVSLALLRQGKTLDSLVNCTQTYTVNGVTVSNYEGYPELGEVPLSSAFANSCNTAFMRAAETISHEELSEAAASLGFGVDYNPGFASFYGLIPDVDNDIARATAMIGQGQVEASPMSMAGVVTSVAAGRTVVPWLVEGQEPEADAKPLTAAEAAELRKLMKLVISEGTATSLRGHVTGAKTGTAQFGAKKPYKWHAWVVAWKGDIAVCAFAYEGKSGAGTAGPIVKRFFS